MTNTNYKILIENRNSMQYNIVNDQTFEPISHLLENPFEHKLFNNDIFTFHEEKVNIVHSSIRSSDSIAAVLILENNKTYGKYKDKLLYKCVPDDVRIPTFLVPYKIKQMGFSKLFINLYVTIRFEEWSRKHPQGFIAQIIGPVDILENFYEYQLYCKSLNTSIQQFQKNTNKFLRLKTENNEHLVQLLVKEYKCFEDRTHIPIFSIDPEKSLDFDDAFSIQTLETGDIRVSIYISNVTIWIDYLQLWESFSRRISTIYLPDKKRPMLPTILSDCLCSLQENRNRIAFALDLTVHNGEIQDIHFSNCVIRVVKNYVYEEPELLQNKDYLFLMETCKLLTKKYKYLNKISDSHDVVSYLMICMNYYCAKDLLTFKNGIFRSTTMKSTPPTLVPTYFPEDVSKFITVWNSFSGQYVDISNMKHIANIKHDVLEMDAYIHITSPIRRLVDLLNMLQFQKNHNLVQLSEKAEIFYQKWLLEIDYINTTMRSIRKVQNDCHLLDICTNMPTILNNVYEGYCFDTIHRPDGLTQTIVYLPELKMTSRLIIREEVQEYEKKMFKLFLFHNEEKFKKKIRLQLI